MAFKLDNTLLQSYEYRGMTSGEGKKGAWHSLRLESPDGHVCEVSVPRDREALLAYCRTMSKGEIYDFPVVVTATGAYGDNPARSYIQLAGQPLTDSTDTAATDEIPF